MNNKITSLQNPLVKHLVKLATDKNYRIKKRSIVISGKKQVFEYSKIIDTLFISDQKILSKQLPAKKTYVVTPQIIKKIANVKSPEGILAEIPMPKPSSLKDKNFILVLDRIKDPGNMGTLIRSALALGWEGVFILENSSDPFNDKATRSAKGANLILPYRIDSWQELKSLIDKEKFTTFAADIKGTPLPKIKKQQKIALVLGSESSGLSLEAKNIYQKITIPINPKQESLNVAQAGAILMYNLRCHG